jgi:hypothetical protein
MGVADLESGHAWKGYCLTASDLPCGREIARPGEITLTRTSGFRADMHACIRERFYSFIHVSGLEEAVSREPCPTYSLLLLM